MAMRRAEPGQYVFYGAERRLMEVVGIGEGRTVHLRDVVGRDDVCPSCGLPTARDVSLMEGSRMFETEVHPVPTISE